MSRISHTEHSGHLHITQRHNDLNSPNTNGAMLYSNRACAGVRIRHVEHSRHLHITQRHNDLNSPNTKYKLFISIAPIQPCNNWLSKVALHIIIDIDK